MKKLSYIILVFYIFNFSKLYSNDIRDFQIEGISIGDSLLNHLSVKEIKAEIKENKSTYDYLTEDFYSEISAGLGKTCSLARNICLAAPC